MSDFSNHDLRNLRAMQHFLRSRGYEVDKNGFWFDPALRPVTAPARLTPPADTDEIAIDDTDTPQDVE